MTGATRHGNHSRQELAAKVARLRQVETYPAPPGTIHAVETHMSWVFLTEHHVYKLKKPVHYPYLDFRTLEARQHNCLEEVRLNRRLAADVYLGMVPLTVDPAGEIYLEGEGTIIDWLVKMRRLPAGRMLDRLIRAHALHRQEIRSVATILSRFYHASTPVPLHGNDYLKGMAQQIQANQQALASAGSLLATQYEVVHGVLQDFLERRQDMLVKRAEQGRIVEGHGDLRPEHICLTPRPVIFDCLEFDRQLRLIDPVDELAFLAMECHRLGEPSMEAELFHIYSAVTGDVPPRPLIPFYQCYRGCMWARLAQWRISEGTDEDKWHDRILTYLRLATQYSREI